ncbi:MAG: hypothetical protein R3320_13850 [Nitriliruptorales bacterium]|nr:hypothetical protein [Nitriliruptorales bacterium]
MTTYHLTDALPAGPLPSGFNLPRRLLERAGTVRVDDVGVTLQGLFPTTVRWERIRSVEIASRLDTMLEFGLGLVPVLRLPGLHSVAASLVDRAATVVAGSVYERARNTAGWKLVRLNTDGSEVEAKRLPALVLTLYPSVTQDIEHRARQREIPVQRVRRLR